MTCMSPVPQFSVIWWEILFGHKVLSEETYYSSTSAKSKVHSSWALTLWGSPSSMEAAFPAELGWTWGTGFGPAARTLRGQGTAVGWAPAPPLVPGWESGGRSLTGGLVSPPEKWDRWLGRSALGTRWDDAPRGPGNECSRHSSSLLNEASFMLPQRGLTGARELHQPASRRLSSCFRATGQYRGPASPL